MVGWLGGRSLARAPSFNPLPWSVNPAQLTGRDAHNTRVIARLRLWMCCGLAVSPRWITWPNYASAHAETLLVPARPQPTLLSVRPIPHQDSFLKTGAWVGRLWRTPVHDTLAQQGRGRGGRRIFQFVVLLFCFMVRARECKN